MRKRPIITPRNEIARFPEARPSCLQCLRPVNHCLCSQIRAFDAHCNLLILQHPNERRKYYSTAGLVTRSIKNSRLLSGVIFDEDKLGRALGSNAYLLFPGTNSRDCEDIELDGDKTVIVLDGTWSEAGKIFLRNSLLQKLPRVSFRRHFTSEYKIRKQPKDRYLSTLESIVHLLRLTDREARNERNHAHLLNLFHSMVERQLVYFPRMQNLAARDETRAA